MKNKGEEGSMTLSTVTALKCTCQFSNKKQKSSPSMSRVKLDICPKLKQKFAKGFHCAKKLKNKKMLTLTLEEMSCLLLQ